MSIKSTWIAAAAALLVIAGCGSQQEPAAKAIAAGESALAAVKDDAARYAPDDLKGVEQSLERMRSQMAEKDYPNVLAAAPVFTKQMDALKATIAANKAEAEAAIAQAKELWPSISTELPKMVEAVQARLLALGKMKQLPQGVDQANVDFARKGLEQVQQEWTAAQADFAAGNVTEAASKANTARRRASDMMARLGIATS